MQGMGDRTIPGTSAIETSSRSTRKHAAILEAATDAFLRRGYTGASMEEVAAGAGVSKQTVYNHFADKEKLFAEVVAQTVDAASELVHAEVRDLNDSGDIEADLCDLARRLLAAVLNPPLLQLRRLVIAEAARFPRIGLAFYARGPARNQDTLAAVFQHLSERSILTIEDSRLAARHFNWLVMAEPLNQAMLLGDAAPAGPPQLDEHAITGVRAFLGIYVPVGDAAAS